ncbi:hypothetical protein BKA23_0164 [Rudaeicoccus suwonensis]|uniref:Uncharacterized protein n=1 Tax=Rudaeicoccus suwonensis TaxID=657409 RepID=A0A561E768_9MICO|nr:hypothetical protein BKA23_0164 [Rudaeicoccus suwonensis]
MMLSGAAGSSLSTRDLNGMFSWNFMDGVHLGTDPRTPRGEVAVAIH